MDTPGYADNLESAFEIGQAGATRETVAEAIAEAGEIWALTFVVTVSTSTGIGGVS